MSAKRKTSFDIEELFEDSDCEKDLPRSTREASPVKEPATKRLKHSSTTADPEDEFLPKSPSAFRFEYRGPMKETYTSGAKEENKTTTDLVMATAQSHSGMPSDLDESKPTKFDGPGMNLESAQAVFSNVVTDNNMTVISPDPIQPLKLDTLPAEVLGKILSYVFPVESYVKPFFSCGTYLLGDRGLSINDSGSTFLPNVDVAFLRVNQACHAAGTGLLYGSNSFAFQNHTGYRPDCARWWMRKIGDRNLKKVKFLAIYIESGWALDRRDPKVVPSPSEMSYEEHWFKTLQCLLHADVKLEDFLIFLLRWPDLNREHGYCGDDKHELKQYRKLIIDVLGNFRDQKHVQIEEVETQYLGKDADKLALLMQQPGRARAPRPPVLKLTLSELIKYCKAENERKEKRMAEELRIRTQRFTSG